MDLIRATEIAMEVLVAEKSRSHPFSARYENGVWIGQDSKPQNRPRTVQVYATGVEPNTLAAVGSSLGWHFITELLPPEVDWQARRKAFRELGYRAMVRDTLMVHDLQEVAPYQSRPPCQRIASAEAWDAIPQASRHRLKWEEGVDQYCAYEEGDVYAWGVSRRHGTTAWMCNLYVPEVHRGKGFGRAMAAQILADNRTASFENCLLIASEAGRNLYTKLGFIEIGMTQVYCPIQR